MKMDSTVEAAIALAELGFSVMRESVIQAVVLDLLLVEMSALTQTVTFYTAINAIVPAMSVQVTRDSVLAESAVISAIKMKMEFWMEMITVLVLLTLDK